MTDRDLLHAVETALPGLDAWHRDLYALARLRLGQGHALKPQQRTHLLRVLRLAHSLKEATDDESNR